MIRALVANVINRAGRSYEIDLNISNLDILRLSLRRAIAAWRGIMRLRVLFFLDSGVTLRAKKNITIARLAAVGHGSSLDGLSKNGIDLGPGSKLGRFVTITGTSHLSKMGVGFTLGARSAIGDFGHIGCAGGVSIGTDVIIGPFVSMHSQEHIFTNTKLPIRHQGTVERAIVIEDDVWVGARATFLAGVRVGRGSVVAAGAVVNKDVAPFMIVGGVPAKVIGSRAGASSDVQPGPSSVRDE